MNYMNFFNAHVQKFKSGPNGQATGLCPLHEDKSPSFSCNINDGVWKCHGCGQSGNAYQLASLLGVDPPEDREKKDSLKEVARYDYHDENGIPRLQVRRYSPKTFRQFRPDGKGDWMARLNGTSPILYRLPEILKSQIVYVVEGEKDVETLRAWKIPATTNPGGASKWRPEFSESLKGKSVVIIPDRDPPGEKHGREVACSLWGKAKAIKILSLPKGKDITVWKESGGTVEELKRLVESTSVLKDAPRSDVTSEERLTLVSLKDLLAEPEEHFDYLVENLLPMGGLSLLSAKPKTGKSTLARQLTLAVARGEEFLGRKTEKGLSIYLALEERRSDVRSHFRKMKATGEENLKIFSGMSPVDGLNLLRKTAEYEKPFLIVVDTMARLLKIKDMNDYSQVTNGLEPILALAREVGSHVLLLCHSKKGDSKGIDSILGSTGLAGSVDTIINLHRTDDYRTLSSIQRDGHDIPETVLQFDSETRITTLGGSREQAEVDRVKNNILSFLAGQESPVTEKAVDEGVDGKTTYKRKALRQLVEEGKINRTGKGGRGSPYHYQVTETDSCSHVPIISVEQGNKIPESYLTACDSKDSSCSPNLALFDLVSEMDGDSKNKDSRVEREPRDDTEEIIQEALAVFPGARVEVLA